MRQKLAFLIFWLAAIPFATIAQQHTIPAALNKGANVIVNSEETVFTVHSPGSATAYFKTSITILNENGLHRAKVTVPYDKLSKVNYIKGTSFDRTGKKIKTLKNSDILDVSSFSDISLAEDNRVKIANLEHTVYPFTVEFEYQTTSSNTMFYPMWAPLDEVSMAVVKATFTVVMPAGMKLRYKEANLPEKGTTRTEEGKEIYTWQLSNLAPFKTEPYMPSMAELVPVVRTAPTDFEVEGYAGSMNNWLNYGQWINKLNAGRDVLPEATKAKITALVADAKTPEEKIKRVYEYLQNNTRYISIQLGIGGWQPFEASFVDSKGYGDCKALTNYTQAMLKTIGIDSYHALIRAGDNAPAMMSEFPSSQFNHVILSVPLKADTLWLECTSQIESAGYLGSFTGNRKALLITPEGGKVVNTPVYTAADNAQHRSVTVKIDEKGNGVANVITRYTGQNHEDHRSLMLTASPEDQRKWLYKNIDIPAFEVNKFSFDLKKGRKPEVTEKLELSLRQTATLSGKRMFLTPNLMNKWDSTPNTVENRKWDVERTSAYTNTDTITYEMPAGYTLEYKPNDANYSTEFGSFKTTTKVDGQKVMYVRTLEMNKGRYKPEAYTKMLEFMNNVVKADGQQLVFVKNIP
ncbi:DUF3857 domain-containing protein [Pontibacter sp. KCTC 32443]|uniref:DUF3857 domain-containing protein n=1 Tax=Pontibacter TaxID=323449 RepID=UPI00164E92BE|nr:MULTISPECIES: DUF3857 domain-containing protein [Pontibacter]MBC5775499.1 DUF3857 domain-containing protein [Pontibacter sp. KCTC 32443]